MGALVVVLVAAVSLAACGSSSSSSRPAADLAVCQQIHGDIQRLYAQSQSSAEQQSLARFAATDRATATKLRGLVAAPGISAQLKGELTATANTIDTMARLQPIAARDPSQVLQTGQQFQMDVQQLQSACK